MSTAVKAPPTTTTSRDSQSPVLVAMADTFIGGMGHPGSPIRVAASMEETFARLPSESDRRRLRLLVGILGRRSGTFLLTGRPVPFHRWPREQRIAVMSSWAVSRLSFRRQLFQVFKRLSLLAFIGDTEDDGTNPVWPEIGYPGPVSAPPPTPKPIRTTVLDGDTTALDWRLQPEAAVRLAPEHGGEQPDQRHPADGRPPIKPGAVPCYGNVEMAAIQGLAGAAVGRGHDLRCQLVEPL